LIICKHPNRPAENNKRRNSQRSCKPTLIFYTEKIRK
jgi:hypothetical protein